LCPADPSVKAKSQIFLYASWGNLILKMQHSMTRQAKQKISANLGHHWSKKCLFLCVRRTWVCPSGTQRFCKITLTWVIDFDSSHSVWNVTRVKSSHHFSQYDSSRVRVTKNRDSSGVIGASHAITAAAYNRIKSEVFSATPGSGLDFVFAEKTLLVFCLT